MVHQPSSDHAEMPNPDPTCGRGRQIRRDPTSEMTGPYRSACRTHWVVSALAAHFGHDRGAENEIAVLATGLDQYLQEVFHHLDYPGVGTLPAADFRALCDVLGLTNERACGDEDDRDDDGGGGGRDGGGGIRLMKDLPERLTFRQFHARLCDHFSCAQCRPGPGERMPVGKENELIEAQIRVRDPVRRRRRTSAVTTTEMTMTSRKKRSTSSNDSGCMESPPRNHGEMDERSTEEGSEEWANLLEVENASLRELVEDLRVALQSSDARCLALNVALRKNRPQEPPSSSVGPHPGPQLDTCISSHLDPYLDAHVDSHLHTHQGAHQDAHVGTHLGTHMNTHLDAHLDAHMDVHQDTHVGAHQDTHQDTHVGAHQDTHMNTHVDAQQDTHMNTHVDAHQDTHMNTHMNTHADAHVRAHVDAAVRRAARRERALLCAREETARRVRAARSLVASGLARVLQLEELCHRQQQQQQTARAQLCSDRKPSLISLTLPRRRSPTGGSASPTSRGEERLLLRAVEGQEAPDEATDLRGGGARGEGGCLALPNRRLALPPDCCPYGCRKGLVKQLVRTFSDPEGSREKGAGRPWEKNPSGFWEASLARGREGGPGDGWKGRPKVPPAGSSEMVELMKRVQRLSAQLQEEQEVRRQKSDVHQWREGLVAELRCRRAEGNRLQAELQILEAERVRLSLVEEKMGDVLHMMQHLRLLNVPRHLLGKILLETLGSCERQDGAGSAAGPEDVSAVLDGLCERLSACELLRAAQLGPSAAPAAGQRRVPGTAATAATAAATGASSLLLSC